MQNRTSLAVLAGLLLATPLVHAQVTATQPPPRIRGAIDRIDGSTMVVKAADGTETTVVLAPDVKVTGVKKAALEDIAPGSYVGCAAVPGDDGSLKALEVTVFPASMRGAGEGSYAWDLAPGSTMTNGTVGDLVVANGRVMTVKFNGVGERKITVPPDAPVVALEPAGASLLTPGAHVMLQPMISADGTLTAGRVNVGENGLVPPA